MMKEELIKQLIEFDLEYIEMLKESKYCRFLCKETFNNHYSRLMEISDKRRKIMKKLEMMNALKTFENDFITMKKYLNLC